MKKILLAAFALCSLGGYALATELRLYQPALPISADPLPTYRLAGGGASAVLPTLTPARKFKAVNDELPTFDDEAMPTLEPAQKR